jgi:hypothetical protein
MDNRGQDGVVVYLPGGFMVGQNMPLIVKVLSYHNPIRHYKSNVKREKGVAARRRPQLPEDLAAAEG